MLEDDDSGSPIGLNTFNTIMAINAYCVFLALSILLRSS